MLKKCACNVHERLSMLNTSNNTNNNNDDDDANQDRHANISDRDMLMTMINVTCALPNCSFIFLSVSRKPPCKTCFGITNTRLEKKLNVITMVIIKYYCAMRFGKQDILHADSLLKVKDQADVISSKIQ